MIKTLIEKELKTIFQTPKFLVTLCVCSLLILLSIFIGVNEHKAALTEYETAVNLNKQLLQESGSYAAMHQKVFRKPDPMQIFVSGIQNDVGRISEVSAHEDVKLTNSVYTDDPIFAVFRFIDLTFIIQIVLSLFAILFTYDAVNGERERGTLKLIFSNGVSRAHYIFAKLAGTWLGLVLPLIVPLLLGVLVVVISGIALSAEHWSRFAFLIASGVLYFTFFVIAGLLVSATTQRSSTSFLMLLILWVSVVLVLPRASIMAASQFVYVPSQAEIEGQQKAQANQAWNEYEKELAELWRQRNEEMSGMTLEERQAYRDGKMWEWMEIDDEARQKVEKEIQNFSLKVRENLRNSRAELQELAFTLSRFSPASAFQLTAMSLADTGIELKTGYEDAVQNYRDKFLDYKDRKAEETGDRGGIRVTMDSDNGFSIMVGRNSGKLDLSDMPLFQQQKRSFLDALVPVIADMGMITILSLLAFAGTFVGFLRYDVR